MTRASRPNILLITTDTSRCDTLGCYGSAFAVSPHLDRLAGEGVLFEQGHTPAPVCMPARCSLMTGVHTPIHGCIENGIQRRNDLLLLPDLLAQAGYTNLMVGKTHFGPVPPSFHVQHVLRGEKSAESDDFYGAHLRRHGYARATRHPNPVPEELFCEAFLADTTIAEIERVVAEGKGPFFAFCSTLSPHGPLDPPGRWAHLFDDRPLPAINYRPGEERRQPRHLSMLLGLEDDSGTDDEDARPAIHDGEVDWARLAHERRLYYGLAAYCDAQIGRLIEFLDRSGLRQDTLVIYTSDHGSQLYDHGFKDKHTFYDASWRVPLLMSWPSSLPAGQRAGFAIWNDLTATILAAAGVEAPFVQGFDLLGPLARGDSSPRRCAVSALYKACAVATSRWKLEYTFEDATGRLFDRRQDPLEQTDLYDDPAHREVRDSLLQALLTWRADLADVQFLHQHTTGGGPVARRAAVHTRQMRGVDAEIRLQETLGRSGLL